MNWTAGILAFLLFWVPMGIIFWRWHKENQRIDREYLERLREIERRYGLRDKDS